MTGNSVNISHKTQVGLTKQYFNCIPKLHSDFFFAIVVVVCSHRAGTCCYHWSICSFFKFSNQFNIIYSLIWKQEASNDQLNFSVPILYHQFCHICYVKCNLAWLKAWVESIEQHIIMISVQCHSNKEAYNLNYQLTRTIVYKFNKTVVRKNKHYLRVYLQYLLFFALLHLDWEELNYKRNSNTIDVIQVLI